MTNEEQITLKVYGQDFKLRVEPSEKKILQKAAALVEQRMQEIASSGVVSLHRVAMLAAIDIAFQAMVHLPEMSDADIKKDPGVMRKLGKRIDILIEKIDKTITEKPPVKGGGKGGSKK